MVVTSSAIKDGVIDDRFGGKGDIDKYGIPSRSIPIKIEDAPQNTVSYAIFMEDKDAFMVSGGFSWVHWTAANITKTELAENESRTANDFVQGLNSWISIQGGQKPAEACSYYGGMSPPKGHGPHIYETNVYALDTMLDLKNGFSLNELFRAMEGHVLAHTVLKGTYES